MPASRAPLAIASFPMRSSTLPGLFVSIPMDYSSVVC
jgi:hypothetical protein